MGIAAQNVLVFDSSLMQIADAIREKLGVSTQYKPAEMADAILSIPTGGGGGTFQSKTATPSESEQTIRPDSGYDALSSVKIEAIPTTYIGSGVPQKSSTDLSASGATVTVPAGYYASQATKSVSAATQATPSISISETGLITASATQTAGYVSAGTKTSTEQLTTKAATTITPSTSKQTAVAANVYTLGAIEVAAMPSGSLSTPTINTSTGVVTATVGTGGYLAQSTQKTLSLTTKAAATITPSESEQTAVNANVYTTGVIKVSAISKTYVGSSVTRQAAKSVTPTKSSQTAVASGVYTTGAITVAAIPAEYIITTGANAAATDIINGQTAYVNGAKITGSLVIQKYYTGSSTPSASFGNDGDLYLKVV